MLDQQQQQIHRLSREAQAASFPAQLVGAASSRSRRNERATDSWTFASGGLAPTHKRRHINGLPGVSTFKTDSRRSRWRSWVWSGTVYPEVTDEQTPHGSVVLSISIVGFGVVTATSGTQGRAGELRQTEARHRVRCTNCSLQGDFATMVEGYFLAGPAQVPLRSVALSYFDGRGNVSQVESRRRRRHDATRRLDAGHRHLPGQSGLQGQSELNIPGNPLSPLSIRFVIADDGNLLLSVLSEPVRPSRSKSTRLSRR